MVTNNGWNVATGATGTVLAGAGVGVSPTFTATPSVTSITFGGTALSNYTEGTFTPTLFGGSTAGSTTYTQQQGYYTRIGNLVTVQAYVGISAATGTGNLTLGGLPFTVKNQTNGYPIGCFFWQGGASWTWPTGATNLSGVGIFNTTTLLVWGQGSAIAGAFQQMANAALAVAYTLTYQI